MEEPGRREPEGGSKAARWFLGCSLAIVLVGFSCAGLAWWGVGALKEWAIEAAHGHVSEFLVEAGLPPEQEASIRADLERLRAAAREGRLDYARFEGVSEELERLVGLGVIRWFEVEVVARADLPEDEMAESRRAMQRLARAVQEGRLAQEEAAAPIQVQVNRRGYERAWDVEDVRVVVRKARRFADELEIPDEPFQLDLASEFRALIDGLLGG